MHPIRLSVSLFAFALVAACGDASTPRVENGAAGSASSAPGPWDTLAALPPADQPYGLDVYTAQCASCHGDLGQGVGKNPPLKDISPTVMEQQLTAFRAGNAAGKAGLSDAEIASVSIYAGD